MIINMFYNNFVLNERSKIYLLYLMFIITGYLLGSILFGYLIPKIFKNVDTKKDSKDNNPGTANAFIQGGIICGMCTLLLELLKGFIPIFLAKNFVSTNHLLFSLIMISPVLGHAYPIYTKFRDGGKCIAVSFGSLLGLFPNIKLGVVLAFWLIFFSTIIIFKPHVLRVLVSFLCFIITSLFIAESISIFIGCFMIVSLVITRHLSTFKTMEGTEVRFAFKKR